MCKAFSCIVDISAKVTWKFGVDSHTELVKLGNYKDNTADPSQMEFARVEITPDNGSYLNPDKWSLIVDECIRPTWFGKKHEQACLKEKEKWQRQLNRILIKKEILHPFEITPPEKITEDHVQLLREWASVGGSVRASVGDSVWDSVGGSVWDSVGDSVWASVGDSVWDSVWDSVGDSVGAYIGSFFQLKKWQYVKHKAGEYPFESAVKLWEQGLVPSFDGTVWRLHGGKKAKGLFEITVDEFRGKK